MFTSAVDTPLGSYPGLTEAEVDENIEIAISGAVGFAVDTVVAQKRSFSRVTNQDVATAATNTVKVLRRALPGELAYILCF